jgi:hypothetical protein
MERRFEGGARQIKRLRGLVKVLKERDYCLQGYVPFRIVGLKERGSCLGALCAVLGTMHSAVTSVETRRFAHKASCEVACLAGQDGFIWAKHKLGQ